MALGPDRMLLHYRLIEKIGEGGMGVVWKARDTTLDRDVAIKTLPPTVAADGERLARFEREAKLLATLNHANVAAVYGLHRVDDLHFMAMELVPGEDLAERLQRGPLAIEDAVDTARQIAEGLEAAHEQGVVHRDLKPANVKRTPDGQIKVLDLGLAKAFHGEASGDPSSLSLSPTVTSAGTLAGTLLGTAAYMSPEQAKARAVDRRADIWAFGCVLYEMLTGKAAFKGDGISETLAAVLRDEIDWDALPAETPAGVRHLLRRCLERNVRTRLRDIGEARVALSPESLATAVADPSLPGATAPAPVGRSRERLAWAIALIATLAAVLAGWSALRPSAAPEALEIRASIRPPEDQMFEAYGPHAGGVSLSPDGTRMTFTSIVEGGRPVLHLRTLSAETAQPLAGTEGATYPFWSPDGKHLAFFADAKLKQMDLSSGHVLTLATAGDARGGTWNRDGTILFAPDTTAAIFRISASGGEATPVTALDDQRTGESTHRYPYFLPDGKHFLFLRGGHSVASEDDVNSIWIGALDGGEPVELMQSVSNVAYAMDHVFFVRDETLLARPFDVATLQFDGEPFVVAEGVVFQPTYWRAAFAVAENGTIAFQGGLGAQRALAWFDRDGTELERVGAPGQFGLIRLSPDGRRLAATLRDPASGKGDIWTFDLDRNVSSRLTFSDAHDVGPVWSPDGKRLAFMSDRDRNVGAVYIVPADGRGQPELVFEAEGFAAGPADWSPDGAYLAVDSGSGRNDLVIVPTNGDDPYPLVASQFDEGYARFTPDGRWIAYLSNESGRYEAYLKRFPSGEGKWQLSVDGAGWLVGWKSDNSEFYFLDLDNALCGIRVELGDRVIAQRPEVFFPTRSENTWDAAGDGQRFILGTSIDPRGGYPITLIVNWAGRR